MSYEGTVTFSIDRLSATDFMARTFEIGTETRDADINTTNFKDIIHSHIYPRLRAHEVIEKRAACPAMHDEGDGPIAGRNRLYTVLVALPCRGSLGVTGTGSRFLIFTKGRQYIVHNNSASA